MKQSVYQSIDIRTVGQPVNQSNVDQAVNQSFMQLASQLVNQAVNLFNQLTFQWFSQ